MATDPPQANPTQDESSAEIECQFRPLKWPVVPRGLVPHKFVVRGADLRNARLQYLVSSGRGRTYVGDVASLALRSTWAGTTEDRR